MSKASFETSYNDPSVGVFKDSQQMPISSLRGFVTNSLTEAIWIENTPDFFRGVLFNDGNSDNEYTFSFPYVITDIADHEVFVIKPTRTNTGSVTMAYFNGVTTPFGALPLKKKDISGIVDLVSGDLQNGDTYLVSLSQDESYYIILGGLPDQSVREQVTNISSSQILNSNTTPVVLVPAPGSGKVIQIISISWRWIWNSIPYATNISGWVGYEAGMSFNYINTTPFPLSLNSDSYGFVLADVGGYSNLSDFENKGIIFQTGTGNPTAGNSSMVFYVTYKIITL